MTGPASFRFLNKEGNLAGGWDNPDQSRLWRYNLHYFDDLNADGFAERHDWHLALIDRWIMENPPGVGSGWEPYPLSLRIVNWIKWSLANNTLDPAWKQSLAVQIRYLAKRLEYHLLGNHLLANAKALIFAGIFFSGEEAARWLTKGLAILERELTEQVFSDGGHFEQSPMYHSIILEDLLDLLNLERIFPDSDVVADRRRTAWSEVVQKMRWWLTVMVHPDGEISFFNDAAVGIAVTRKELESYAGRLGFTEVCEPVHGITKLAESGYIRLQSESAVALLDVGMVGPDYLPAHSHADTLSFELSIFGQRVVVNSGTSCYGNDPERLWQRSTAAHSTVEVDNISSSEVWGGFRVARRARPFALENEKGDTGLVVRCAHDGYRRLSGRPVHLREWRFEGCSLTVTDKVDGGFDRAMARFYLHPEVHVQGGGTQGELFLPGGQRIQWSITGGTVLVRDSFWYPAFGRSVNNRCLEIQLNGVKCSMKFQWSEKK